MVKIIHREDRGVQVGGDGATTFTHVIQFEGNSLMEITTSHLLPQRGSRHPENTAFFLNEIQISPNGNKGRGVQALATLTYSNSAELVRDFTGDPWDLGAQNFSSQYQTISGPWIWGFDADGNIVQNLNTANCPILAETTENFREISFTYCVRARSSGEAPVNDEAIINEKAETVAGISIPERTGLLLPMTSTFITEYEGGGDRIKRQYWEVSATVQINRRGWVKELLNVGTMAFFKTNGALIAQPRNIYRYTPWESADPAVNLKTHPAFGCIDDVIAAKETYAKIKADAQKEAAADMTDDQYRQVQQTAWNELPFEEVTEPMPLADDGTLDYDAIADPVNYPYRVIERYEFATGSWNAYNLPRRRA